MWYWHGMDRGSERETDLMHFEEIKRIFNAG
jgi:hypothetical protein